MTLVLRTKSEALTANEVRKPRGRTKGESAHTVLWNLIVQAALDAANQGTGQMIDLVLSQPGEALAGSLAGMYGGFLRAYNKANPEAKLPVSQVWNYELTAEQIEADDSYAVDSKSECCYLNIL
jgi:hypothetical protein